MSSPSLADRLALAAADPAPVGHPVVAGLVTVVGELERELVSLREENAELRRQLGRHSGNRGQPPSQDGPTAPPRPRRRRRLRGRQPGGQPGHAGTTRRQVAVAQVDVRVEHWPARCGGCGTDLPRVNAGSPARRQMHDLPPPPPLAVTEHRAHAARAARLREQALAVPVACMDETSLRVAGKRLWLHGICDGALTYYRLGGRGDVWTEYVGTAVHDRFAPYLRRLPEETAHGICNAHLLRNLEEIVEGEQAPHGWAARMQRLLRRARDAAVHWCEATGGPVPEPVRAQTAAAWDALLAPALDRYESLPPPARGRRRGHNLARALWTLRDACLLFLADPAVPFTNNRAEQALRRARLQMKIAGGFRTRAGAERFAHMRGLAETARKQGHNLLDLLRQDPDAPPHRANPVPPWPGPPPTNHRIPNPQDDCTKGT